MKVKCKEESYLAYKSVLIWYLWHVVNTYIIIVQALILNLQHVPAVCSFNEDLRWGRFGCLYIYYKFYSKNSGTTSLHFCIHQSRTFTIALYFLWLAKAFHQSVVISSVFSGDILISVFVVSIFWVTLNIPLFVRCLTIAIRLSGVPPLEIIFHPYLRYLLSTKRIKNMMEMKC